MLENFGSKPWLHWDVQASSELPNKWSIKVFRRDKYFSYDIFWEEFTSWNLFGGIDLAANLLRQKNIHLFIYHIHTSLLTSCLLGKVLIKCNLYAKNDLHAQIENINLNEFLQSRHSHIASPQIMQKQIDCSPEKLQLYS